MGARMADRMSATWAMAQQATDIQNRALITDGEGAGSIPET
jgi:hypothetical protein